MAKYVGVKCSACEKRFASTDDVVVCPICGAPHHRECYAETGTCAFLIEHITGKEWHPEPKYPSANGYEEEKAKLCSACGSANPSLTIFCQICGRQMNTPKHSHEGSAAGIHGIYGDPFGGIPKDEKISGLAVNDIKVYVGPSSSYYVPRFYAMDKLHTKVAFSLPALVFNFLYFFYRKMYLVGILLLALFIIGLIPQMLHMREALIPELLYEQGFIDEVNIDREAAAHYEGILSIAALVNLIVRVVIAFFANRLYYNKVIREVAKITKDAETTAEKGQHTCLIARRGGVDKVSVALTLAAIGTTLSLISYMMITQLL